MANTDNPKGFAPAGKTDGSPWNSLVRSMGCNDAADIFIGDALLATSGLAVSVTAGGANDASAFIGVAVGFGLNETASGIMGGDGGFPFDYDDLMNRYYDDSGSTHTEWTCFFVPAKGSLFRVQADGDESAALLLGTSYDGVWTTGDTTTGISNHEINGDQTAADNTVGMMLHRMALRPDNVPAEDFAEYLISFNGAVL